MRRIFFLPWVITALVCSVVWSPPLALAQAAQGIPGITVFGRGEASAPADTATLLIVVGEPNYGPPPVPQPGVVPGEREREAVAPVVAALVEAGVPEDEIDVFVGSAISVFGTEFGPATAALRITLDSPTVDRINDLIIAATSGAAEERLVVARVLGVYSVQDCGALERDAREQAVMDAREQADTMAGLLGVLLGPVVSSRDITAQSPALGEYGFAPYGPPDLSRDCEEQSELADSVSRFIYLPPLDLLAEPEVSSYASVELIFSISTETEATPAT